MAKKETTYEQICRDIVAHQFSPIYVLMGDEPYFIDKILDLLIANVLKEEERDFNQIILYGADVTAVTVLNSARRFPMMAEHQLVVVREAQLIKDIELLTTYVQKPLQSTILVICYKYKTLDRRKTLALAAEKNGVVFDSKKIPDYKLVRFITDFIHQRSYTIDMKAAQMLSDYLGNDLSRLSKELDKLSVIMSEKSLKSVTPDLIEKNIGISKEYNNFELLKAISVKDVLKSNRIIQYFARDPKDNPIQLTLSVLFNYFANLMICFYAKDRTEAGIMYLLGFHSTFQTENYMAGMRSFKPMKVYYLIDEIRRTDAKSKGVNSAADSDELLKELVYKILH